jgi:hypothetical protein
MIAKTKTHARITDDRAQAIAKLNDAFRRGEGAGRLAITSGVMALGGRALIEIMAAVQSYDGFNVDNDPHGEHDFASIAWRRERLFWKIDCYDRRMEHGSPDAADPSVTTRVLTIMLASEY